MTGHRLPDEQAADRVLTVVFRHTPDALLRIVGLLNRCGIALAHLELRPTAEAGISRLDMGVNLSARDCRLLCERLRRLIPVLDVDEGNAGSFEGRAPGGNVVLPEDGSSRSGSDTGRG